MKEFIIKLLTANSGLSSKRFISVLGMFVFIMVVVCSFFDINPPDPIIYGLVTIIIGSGGMTLLQNK